jgi:hypothetical protein
MHDTEKLVAKHLHCQLRATLAEEELAPLGIVGSLGDREKDILLTQLARRVSLLRGSNKVLGSCSYNLSSAVLCCEH